MSGLNGTTTYNVSVQAICGVGDSSDTETISFTTLLTPGTCGIFTVVLTDSYGDGWGGNGLEVVLNGTPTDTLTFATGSSASFQIAVDVGDVLDLNYLNTGTWGGENGWNVTDNNSIVIVSVPPTNNGGSAGAGPANTVGIAACPACSAPSGISASNITTNNADVSWTAGGTETSWNVEYGISGFVQGAGLLSTVNATLLSLTGLSSATFYDVYVQADCGSGRSSLEWSFSRFVTPFNPPSGVNCNTGGNVAIIFSEEFDNNNAGWTGNIGNSNGNWEIPNNATSNNTGADAAHSGSNYMNYEASTQSPNTGNIVSPAIDLSTAQIQAELSFGCTHLVHLWEP